MSKRVKILMGAALFIGATAALVFYLTAGLTNTADAFFDAVQQDDMTTARGYLSTDTRAHTSEADLKRALTAMGIIDFQQASWPSRSFTGARGKLSGTVTTMAGAVVPVNVGLVKEHGHWRIYSLLKAGSGPRATTADDIREKAENGDSGAQVELGLRYHDGRGVPRDDKVAVAWFRKAADRGDAQAQFNMGVSYEHGIGVERDAAKAVAWYRKAADQGYARAQTGLGYALSRGEGVAKDRAEALKWYRKAADQGQPGAQYNLGLAYFDGNGLAQDYAKALAWFRKAAVQGQDGAQNHLGYMYQNGKGVARDSVQAASWFRKAADRGNHFAQFNLAMAYAKGRGIERNDSEACFWMMLAAKFDPDARKKLEDCKARLTSDQVVRIQSRADKWRPSREN